MYTISYQLPKPVVNMLYSQKIFSCKLGGNVAKIVNVRKKKITFLLNAIVRNKVIN